MEGRMPSMLIFISTWLVLLLYLTIEFVFNADKMFLQLNYNWKNLTIIETINNVIIDSIANDYVVLRLFSNYEPRLFNSRHTFSINGDKMSYFRTTSINQTDTSIIFSGVKWLNRFPMNIDNEAAFQIVDVPLIQSGDRTVTTIGDSQMFWREGRDFRKNLSKNKDLVFKGRNIDVYGYPNEADVVVTSKTILNNITNIEPTRIYVLFFGAHDKNKDFEVLVETTCNIFELLNERNQTEYILVITLPPSSVSEFEEYNKKFNNILKKCAKNKKKIKIVDLYKSLKKEQDYIYQDNVHLNQKGFRLLNKLLLKELK